MKQALLIEQVLQNEFTDIINGLSRRMRIAQEGVENKTAQGIAMFERPGTLFAGLIQLQGGDATLDMITDAIEQSGLTLTLDGVPVDMEKLSLAPTGSHVDSYHWDEQQRIVDLPQDILAIRVGDLDRIGFESRVHDGRLRVTPKGRPGGAVYLDTIGELHDFMERR